MDPLSRTVSFMNNEKIRNEHNKFKVDFISIVAGVYVKNSPKFSASICIKLTKLPSETFAYKEVLSNLSYINESN